MNTEQIETIRAEQQAQYHAASTPLKKVLQAISNVCHPLLMLTYAAVLLCSFTTLTVLPIQLKLYFVGKVFFYTTLMPALSIYLMHTFHLVGHWALRDRRDRALPFVVNSVFYGINAYSLSLDGFFPSWVLLVYYGAFVLMLLFLVISLWWKVSAHASGNAALATVSIITFLYFPELMPLWLCAALIVTTGLVSSIRVYLGRHTLAQVGVGALLGVLGMVAGWLVWG